MNSKLAKLVTLSLSLLSALAIAAEAAPQSGEHYMMDGKPVPRSFFDAGQLVNEGTNLLRANRNQEASVKLQQAIAIAPDFAEAHHNYGLALAKLGNVPNAVEQFQLALKLKPNLDTSWLSLGGLYQSTGRVEDAIKIYREFLTRFPNNRDAPKVASLVQGLQKEFANESKQPIAAASWLAPAAEASPDDYLADVTRRGMMRWPAERMPLKVHLHSGDKVPGFDPKFETILKKSFDDWAQASDGLVKFEFVASPTQADIDVSWTSDSAKFANSAESGETRLTSNKFGILHGVIQLLTVPLMPGILVTANRIRMISLHEIGHVLGLTGHTSNPDDAMFYSATIMDQWRSLSARDAKTIFRLYSTNRSSPQKDGP